MGHAVEVVVLTLEDLDEEGIGGNAGNDGGAVITALTCEVWVIEAEPGLLFALGVAGMAMLGEDGKDLPFEVGRSGVGQPHQETEEGQGAGWNRRAHDGEGKNAEGR
jgi:hypothetical protein